MQEHVLLLDRSGNSELIVLFHDFGIDSATHIKSEAELIFEKGWFNRYTTIVMDSLFCGNTRDGASLVRRIRREYYDPIIALDTVQTNEGVYPLRIAGCTFILPSNKYGRPTWAYTIEGRWQFIRQQLFEELSDIHGELPRSHHQASREILSS